MSRPAVCRAAEQVEPVLVDPAQIAAAQGDAVAIEELQNSDRNLAAVVDPVAELGRGELGVGLSNCGAEIDDDADHLGHRLAQEEMIERDFVGLAHAAKKLEQAPDVGLALGQEGPRCRARVAGQDKQAEHSRRRLQPTGCLDAHGGPS